MGASFVLSYYLDRKVREIQVRHIFLENLSCIQLPKDPMEKRSLPLYEQNDG